jgi:uncharacterized protein (TIGR00730 family)
MDETQITQKKLDTTEYQTERERVMAAAEQRLLSTDHEFTEAYEILRHLKKTVTFFGSARLGKDHPYYQKARELARILAHDGYAVVTGGGGGIMQAANQGAHEVGGESIGLNIQLPHEQTLNPYVTQSSSFHYFFARKVMLTFYADALVVFPGGFGTIDEFSEVLTLIQTKKMPAVPIILVGVDFWTDFDMFVKKHLIGESLVSPGDDNLYTITDDLNHIRSLIDAHDQEAAKEPTLKEFNEAA